MFSTIQVYLATQTEVVAIVVMGGSNKFVQEKMSFVARRLLTNLMCFKRRSKKIGSDQKTIQSNLISHPKTNRERSTHTN